MALDAAAKPFRPDTVTPPDAPLPRLRWLMAFMRNPIGVWDRFLFENPYRKFDWRGGRVLQIASPDLMQKVLLDCVDAFEKSPFQQRIIRPAAGDGLLVVEGETWRRQRRAAAPAFRHDALHAMVPSMAKAGADAAERLAKRGGGFIDVAPEMTRATFDVIAQTLLGGDDPDFDQEDVARSVATYIETIGAVDALDVLGAPEWIWTPKRARGHATARAMRRAAMSALARRRASGQQRGDLLGQMLAARDPETGAGLSDQELRDNIVTFIAAGHETTAVALTWTLYLIANDAAVQQRLFEEVRDVAGNAPLSAAHVEQLVFHEHVIKEAMRLYPPVALLQRRAVRDVDLGPVSLKAGEEAVCLIYCMQRNKLVWDQPDLFIPDRFAPEHTGGRHRFAHMPFGGGPRICIAMKFAYLEAAAILANLVRRLRFAPKPDHAVKPILRVTMRPKGGMPLHVSPRV